MNGALVVVDHVVDHRDHRQHQRRVLASRDVNRVRVPHPRRPPSGRRPGLRWCGTRGLADLPPGDALDAACGTGRFAAMLADHGCTVVGVDSSPDMLQQAHEKVRAGTFMLGDLRQLPVPDDSFDVVTCGLALAHLRRWSRRSRNSPVS